MLSSVDIFEPMVTIIIPVYNGQDFLAEAIDSALAQSYCNIEVIVVNDGSTDQTEKVAKSYGEKIRYFHKNNGGVASALNFAIQQAKGEYISWLSHDDLYFAEKIEQQIETLRNLQNRNSIIFSNYVKFSKISRFLYHDFVLYTEKQLLEENKAYVELIFHDMDCIENQKVDQLTMISLLFRGCINGCTLLIPKMLFSKIRYFNEELLTTQDYDLWFKFIKNDVDFIFLRNFVVKCRQHKKQGSKDQRARCKKEERQLFKKAGITFFGEVVYMKNIAFYNVKKRFKDTKNWLILFWILLYRYLIGLFR